MHKSNEIHSAMFTDRSKQFVKYMLKDGTQHVASFDPKNPLAKEILKVVPIIGLERNFVEFERKEATFKRVATMLNGSEDQLTKMEEALKDWEMVDHFVTQKENFHIFLGKKDRILYLLDNWDFVNGQLNEDAKVETEIIEKVVEKEISKPITLESLEAFHTNKENFFKLKLEIFEKPEVKESKDRAWKAKMRKASSIIELLAALNEGPEKKKNESSEPQD